MNIDRYTYLLLAASLCFGIKSSAQGVCSSNALAPVFKQTFDSSKTSTTKTTVPVGFVTNYKFQNKNPLADGEYIVTPLVQNAQRGDWAVGGDHTGNLNGNMFLVNAGTGASRFFYQQVDNLCPGSVYSFSAWLLNANTISKTMPICDDDYVWPRVTFNIKNTSGTILQSFTTDTLPLTKNTSVAPNWKQYGFQFALPSGTTSLILEMVDFYGGKPQCGNDLAIDDIVFSACTPTTTIALSTGSSICSGTSTSITSSLVNSPFSNPAYQWQKSTDGGTTWNNIGTAGTSATSYSIASAVVTDGGLYRVVVGPDVASLSSSTCTSASNTITLTVNPSPAVTVSSVSAICSGNTFSITSNATSGTTPYSYSWTGPNSFTSTSANPSIANIAAANAGTYSLILTDAKSCTATASTSVTVATTPVVAAITGNSGACAGTTISLSNATPGGTWSSDNTAVATVSSGGFVTLVSGGTATISYTVNNGSCSATATKVITSASVALHPDVIECNNGITHFTSTDLYYGVTYSNSDAGNTYAWSITGGSFSYQGSSNSSSQYPSLQLLTGSTFQAVIQFTTHGVTCSDTQMIYKNTVAADTIQGSHDTTVCFTTGPIALSGKASPVTNTFSWTTSGSGVFSSPNTLNTTYTPSAADKAAGTITIFLSGASTLNSTGNCGTSTSIDSMILRIYPDNTGTNATQVICSNQAINFTPSSAIPGSTYSWISAVTAGTLTGNTTNGTGNIIDSLVNLSNTTNAIVTYTITPYAFTPSNKTCTGTPFTFTVTANPKPAVGVTNNAAGICTGSSTDIRFNSSITGSTYTWSSVVSSGAATGNSASATPSATNKINDVLTNGSSANATVRYRITAISPAGCSRTDSTEVIVYAVPTAANAGPDRALCDVTTTLLAANSPVLGTGNWALVSGPSTPTFVSPSSASSSINGLVTGTYQLSWTITNGVCGVSSDTVIIVNAPQTVAGSVSANATVCEGINSGTLILSGYTGSIIRWEASADGGATWPVVINNTTNTYSYANLTTTTLFRAVVQSGACSFANSNPAVITVNPVTVPGALSSDAVVCTASNSGTLTLSGYTGSIIRWESSADNGSTWPTTINNTTNTYQYTNLTATTLFRVVVQSGNCSAANSNAITITVSPQTIAGTVSASATVCAGINNGTLTLGGYTGNILDWESSIDNGATWSTISNTTNSLTYTNLTATTVYRALVQSGACASLYSGTAMISVVKAVTVANAGTDQVLCSTTSASLNANTAVSGTGAWTNLAGNPTVAAFTNANDPKSTVNGLTTGVYQFVWTISNGLCADSKDTVQITVNPQTVPGALASSATVCAVANTGTLSLTGYTGNIIRWESSVDNGVTWINIINTTSALVFNNLSVTTQYRAAVQSGVCAPLYSNIVTITVLQAVTVANAGTDQVLCSTTSALLNAHTAVSGTGTWTNLAGNPTVAAFTNANDPTSTVNGLTTGVYQFVWTISNGLCADSKDTVQITVNPQTVPGTLASSATVCAVANTGTLSLSGYTGNIVRWESSVDNGVTWINIINTTSALVFNNLSVTTQYRAAVQSGVCAPLYSNIVTITVLQAVTVANAGIDQALCNVGATTLAGNVPGSGTGTWTALAGNPSAVTFTNPNNPGTTVNGLIAGTYQFVWTVSNGFCADSKDTVQVIVYPATVPGVLAADATACATSNNGTLSLSGYLNSIVRWESSIDNGATWSNIPNTNNTFTYNDLPTTTKYRAYVQNAVCPALYSNIVTINILQPVTVAYAGSDTTVINGITSYKLNANTPVSGTGTWSVIPGGPSALSFINVSDPKTTVGGLTFNPGTPPTDGIYKLVWTVSNGYCAISRDTMQITVQPPTNPGVIGPDAVVCTNNNHGSLALSDYLGNILQWESSIDYGATWTVIPRTVGTNQDTLVYDNLTTTTLFRALVKNGVGLSLYSGIAATVTVLQLVTPANAGPDQNLCNSSSTTLAGNTPTSGTGTWSALAGNPTATSFSNAANPATVVNGMTNGTYNFVWSISNGICDDSKDTVSITIQLPTIAGSIAADATVCVTSNTGTLNISGFRGNIVNGEVSIDNGATWTVIPNTANKTSYTYNNLGTTSQFRAMVQNSVCPALYTNIVTIFVLPEASIANAGTDQSLCNVTATTLSGNTPSSGTGLWSSLAGNPSAVSFTNPVNPATTVNGLIAGTYQFVWTISNALCADSKDTVKVIVHPPTVAGRLAADATVCATANNGTLALSGFVGSILRWESSVDNGGSWNNIANTTNNFVYNNLAATTLYRAYVQNAVCPAIYSNNVIINVVQPVTIANAGTDQSLCNVTATTLSGNTPSSGTGLWTSLASNPSAVSFTNPVNPSTTVNGLIAGTYQFVWTISNALCADSKDTVKVIVHPPTVPGTLVTDATVCATANNGTLALSGFVGSILRWESSIDNGNSWNNIANTTNNFVYNNLAATTLYRAYVQNAVCPAIYSNNVTINVVQPVTIANAGTDQSLCNVTAVALRGNTPSSGTGLWSSLAGNPSAVTFTNPVDPATTVNGLIAGTYQFVWTISNALCTDSKDTVKVIVHPPTVAGTLAADAFVCVGGNGGALAITGYTGSIHHWESSVDNGATWTIINQTSATLTYTNIIATTLYRALVQSGNCNGLYTNTVTVHVYPASVGGKLSPAADTACATSNKGSLLLNGFTGTIMHWEFSTDKGSSWTIINTTDSTYSYTSLTATTWYRVLIQSGNCSVTYSDTAIITIDSPTVAGVLAGTAIVCNGENSGSLILSGRTGTLLHWESSTDNGSTWTIIASTTDTLTYTNLTATTQYRALVKHGACAMQYSNVISITAIEPVTKANAGADQVLCEANYTTTLDANMPTSGAGKWIFISGSSTVSFANPALPNTTVTGLRTGTYRFAWTISNGICSNSADTVTIRVDKVVSGFNLSSINDCGKTTYQFINTSQSAFGIQSWKWYTKSGDTINTKNHSMAFTTEGLRDMSLTVQSTTGCTNTIEALYKVIVYEFPKANINAIASVCKSQFMQVSSDVSSKDSIAYMLWNLGNGVRAKDSVVTVQYVNDGNYTVKLTVATINRCLDSTFKQIAVHPIPAISITSSPVVCKGGSIELKASGAMNYIWTDDNNKIICDGCVTTRVNPAYNSRYKVIGYSEYGCSQIQTTDLRVVQPLKMIAAKGDTLCVGQSKQLFASGASSYTWYPETGLSNKNASSPIANPLATTSYHVIGKDNYNCFTDTAEVNVVVGKPTPINIGKDTVITAGSIYQLTAKPDAQDIRKWIWYSPVELSCRNCATPQVKISDDISIYCTAINIYGCASKDTLAIKTFCPATEIFIPNAFTPDGDGINDLLIVQGRGVKMIKSFRIFNRWGEIVFEKSNFLPGDPAYGWDGRIKGKPAPPDVFVYVAEVICEKGLPTIFKGNVAILK